VDVHRGKKNLKADDYFGEIARDGAIGWKLLQRMAKMLREARED